MESDGTLASIGYVAANPNVDKSIRGEGLDMVLSSLEKIAADHGRKMITVCTNVPALQARYEAHGFRVTDVGVKHYVKEI